MRESAHVTLSLGHTCRITQLDDGLQASPVRFTEQSGDSERDACKTLCATRTSRRTAGQSKTLQQRRVAAASPFWRVVMPLHSPGSAYCKAGCMYGYRGSRGAIACFASRQHTLLADWMKVQLLLARAAVDLESGAYAQSGTTANAHAACYPDTIIACTHPVQSRRRIRLPQAIAAY